MHMFISGIVLVFILIWTTFVMCFQHTLIGGYTRTSGQRTTRGTLCETICASSSGRLRVGCETLRCGPALLWAMLRCQLLQWNGTKQTLQTSHTQAPYRSENSAGSTDNTWPHDQMPPLGHKTWHAGHADAASAWPHAKTRPGSTAATHRGLDQEEGHDHAGHGGDSLCNLHHREHTHTPPPP